MKDDGEGSVFLTLTPAWTDGNFKDVGDRGLGSRWRPPQPPNTATDNRVILVQAGPTLQI